jgi:putative membrane protein|tara:strand:+ start:3878 stop:4780 length:903 start_codon:yes stop_codon:yes gene_type:complete
MKFNNSLFFKGMLMGVAEIIPGVSGGTLAFITGIYKELIDSIKSVNLDSLKLLFKFQFKNFWYQINGNFLSTLLMGMIVSILILSRFIAFLLDNHHFKIWGFFFGLIICSAFIIFKSISKLTPLSYLLLSLGLVLSGYISLVAPSSTPNTNIFIFLSGAIAISAMILPGISGSFMLVFLSKYEFILSSLNSFEVNVLTIFLAGCVTGLVTFSRLLSYLFKNYYDNVVSILVGFLFGSLIKIWPFYEIIELNQDNEPLYTNPVLPNTYETLETIYFITFAIVGILSIWFIEKKFIGIGKEY